MKNAKNVQRMDEYIGTYSYHPNYISCYSPGCFMSVFENIIYGYTLGRNIIYDDIHNSASLRDV